MKQRYKWEVRVGGVLLSQGGKKQSGWNWKREMMIRECKGERQRVSALGRAIIQQTILFSLLLLLYSKNYNFLEVHFVKTINGAWGRIKEVWDDVSNTSFSIYWFIRFVLDTNKKYITYTIFSSWQIRSNAIFITTNMAANVTMFN